MSFLKIRSRMISRLFQCSLAALLFFPHILSAATSYGSFSSLTTQLPKSTGFTLAKMDVVESAKNVELTPDRNRIQVKESGLYFIIVSGQVGVTQRGAKGDLDLWFEKNGIPVINSNIRLSVTSATTTVPITFQIVLELAAGDTIATAYSASGPSLGFLFFQPDNEPAVTSFYLSLFKIDNL